MYSFKSVVFIKAKGRLWLLFNICVVIKRQEPQLSSIAGSLRTAFFVYFCVMVCIYFMFLFI